MAPEAQNLRLENPNNNTCIHCVSIKPKGEAIDICLRYRLYYNWLDVRFHKIGPFSTQLVCDSFRDRYSTEYKEYKVKYLLFEGGEAIDGWKDMVLAETPEEIIEKHDSDSYAVIDKIEFEGVVVFYRANGPTARNKK
jgi:hypothetical protein